MIRIARRFSFGALGRQALQEFTELGRAFVGWAKQNKDTEVHGEAVVLGQRSLELREEDR